ncbi:MAG: type II toxin-antitoxin system prevent-host-death family antitoxin, partial [Cellvibrionaceae bacterium]|nr:type II toxin-antitoxin system prevent-host-death family antitoxin [Cellvibrionaceae bacterium]
ATNHKSMTMKVMSAKDAKNSFGNYIDATQREAVIVTKHDRPVTISISSENVDSLIGFANEVQKDIREGVLKGLQEATEDKGDQLNQQYISNLKQKLTERISNQ